MLSLIQDLKGYEPEFVNASVELIHKNEIETAYKLVSTISNPSFFEAAGIFIKQLIRCNEVYFTWILFITRNKILSLAFIKKLSMLC